MSHRLRALAVLTALVATLALPTGGVSQASTTQRNAVIDWNQTMLATFSAAKVPPPPGNRLGAIVQSAVFDAVNGIERRYTAIHVPPAAPPGASPEAAAVSAAYTALITLFPAQKPALDTALATSLAAMPDEDGDSQSLERGLEWGQTVADQIVAWRATDGFSAPAPIYVFGTKPGDWQATPGGSGPPKFQQLATCLRCCLSSAGSCRRPGCSRSRWSARPGRSCCTARTPVPRSRPPSRS